MNLTFSVLEYIKSQENLNNTYIIIALYSEYLKPPHTLYFCKSSVPFCVLNKKNH